MKVQIKSDKLPHEIEEKFNFLFEYFSGKEIGIKEINGVNEVTLSNHTSKDYYIDSKITSGLQWWNKSMLIDQIPSAFKNLENYFLTLNDNWTLFAWSKWLEEKKQKDCIPKEIVILHIDDHLDCMAPLLHMIGEDLLDPITQRDVNIYSPPTVKSAIESGSISIGSFLTVFLHSFSKIHLRHLLPDYRKAKAHSKCFISKCYYEDHILTDNGIRPAVSFANIDHLSELTYTPFFNSVDFAKDIDLDTPILLHVDMDYFNNRFDGDSDWRYRDLKHDPNEHEVYQRIETVFNDILSNASATQIENVTIALSPGFFPSEFWGKSIEIINRAFS